MCQLITQVVSGEFNPDATRSGLFIPRPDDAELEASDLSGLGSEDEDDADVFEEDKAVEGVAGRWQPDDVKDGCTYFRHSSSRCIHKTMDEAGSDLRAAEVFQSDMRDRLNARSFSTLCVVRVLGIIMPDALT